jgi:hypothetical protein
VYNLILLFCALLQTSVIIISISHYKSKREPKLVIWPMTDVK